MDKFIFRLQKKANKELWNCLDVLYYQILRIGKEGTRECSFDPRLQLTAVFTSPGRGILMALIA